MSHSSCIGEGGEDRGGGASPLWEKSGKVREKPFPHILDVGFPCASLTGSRAREAYCFRKQTIRKEFNIGLQWGAQRAPDTRAGTGRKGRIRERRRRPSIGSRREQPACSAECGSHGVPLQRELDDGGQWRSGRGRRLCKVGWTVGLPTTELHRPGPGVPWVGVLLASVWPMKPCWPLQECVMHGGIPRRRAVIQVRGRGGPSGHTHTHTGGLCPVPLHDAECWGGLERILGARRSRAAATGMHN